MEKVFDEFDKRISLTRNQVEDGKKKYNGVCKCVHNEFYDKDYNGSTKFLFGSYKLKTNIRPLTESQDVDVLIKLPNEIFEQYDSYKENGQSALLDKIRKTLAKTYTTTDKIKAWGKVILINFAENKHNVELLPAFEQEDKTFLIPNSENGGSWDIFDPRTQIDEFNNSNSINFCNTRILCKMIKTWRNNISSLTLKSYKIQELVIDYFNDPTVKTRKIEEIIHGFFVYAKGKLSKDYSTYFETAITRSTKAINYIAKKNYSSAHEEYIKIFGPSFPSYDSKFHKTEALDNTNKPKPWLYN